MATIWSQWRFLSFIGLLVLLIFVAEARKKSEILIDGEKSEEIEISFLMRFFNFFWQNGPLGRQHVWPEMKFGWPIVVGSIIGFLVAACGSVGGVGGGGIFVPMLTLIIGFDAKSSTAMSKCMITGAAASTVYSNLKLRHPTLDMPVIDYDLALLFQPVLVLGISIGIIFNVIFQDWMITVLLITLFVVTSTKAFYKGVETWKRETIIRKEAARHLASFDNGGEEEECRPLLGGPNNGVEPGFKAKREEVSVLENVRWKELGLLIAVWLIILLLEIMKKNTTTCSVSYWVCNLLQIPVALGVSAYQAVSLYKGRRRIASKGEGDMNWSAPQLVFYCACGLLAGIVGGLLGLGGGFILGPLFLELGVPPQVSSATATFAMTFSASMSVIENYLLQRFPVPYALYFSTVTAIAAFVGQRVMRKLIGILGRASIIVFVLSFTIFVSAISLGGFGIADMIEKIEKHEYIGFENICS